MKTENTNTTETSTMNNETQNTPTAETPTATANTTATTPYEVTTAGTAQDNARRLAELAGKIRAAYATELAADGMVVDWKAKQLKAGIEMGEYLNEAKDLVPPKGFIKWCRANFAGLNIRSLNRYMKLARSKTLVSEATGLKQAYNTIAAAEAAEKRTANTAEADATTEAAGDSEVSQETQLEDEFGKFFAPDKEEDSDLEADFKKVKGYLTKAKDILNGYQDLAACEEAEAVCDLIDALAGWVSEYRKPGDNLSWLPPANVEVPLDNTTPEHEAELAVTE